MSKGATSLRDLKDKITSVQATELERRIGSTIIDSYRDIAKAEFLSGIKAEEGKAAVHNIAMPTLQYFCDEAPGLREKLINLYNSKMNMVPGFENIPDNVKVSQGALLDGLCYVYDMHTGNVTLATMNLDILYDLAVETDMQKQIISKNMEGLCKAYRIDIEYINGDQEFYFKAVNARNYDIDDPKADSDPTKNFVLVPYTAGIQLMKICENLLDRGAVLRIRQILSGTVKLRFLTTNQTVLNAYCSSEAFQAVKPSFFPLKSYFYAPVVGASPLTAMVSRVNLFDIDSISLADGKQLKGSDIRKVENPVRDLFGERYFVSEMMRMKEEDLDRFVNVVGHLSKQGKLITDIEKISSQDLSSYMHSVTPTAIEKAYRLAGVEDQIDHVMKYLSGDIRPMTVEEMKNLEDTLDDEVCKFTIRKKDCSLGSVLATNNRYMVQVVYGKDLPKYESFSKKFYRFASFLNDLYDGIINGEDTSTGSENWKLVKEEMEDQNFPFSDETYTKIISAAEDASRDLFINRVKVIVANLIGVNVQRSEAASESARANRQNGVIQCKSLTATLDGNGKPVDFYKNLDKSKIVSAWVLETRK